MSTTLTRKFATAIASLALITGFSLASPTQASAAAAQACMPNLALDSPHISSTAPRAVQGHGWWKGTAGNCSGWRLRVRVLIQVKTTFLFWEAWGTVATGPWAWVKDGGGAGNRATGRFNCPTNTMTTFRTIVQGELQTTGGIWGAIPGAKTSANQDYRC